MFPTLLKKELREQRRTHRLLIFAAGFALIGLLSPLIARYTPVLLRNIPDVPAELAAIIPDPTLKDAVEQYTKNFTQLGLLLVVVLTMGIVAQEKERGTAGMLFTKPVRRSAFVLAKWLASMGSLLVGLLLAALGCLIYTWILFEPLPIGGFVALNALLAVFLGFFLTLALTGSALARSQPMAAGFAFALIIVALALSALPLLGDYMPSKLLDWGWSLVMGGDASAWPALLISLGLMGLALLVACLYIEKEEL